MARSPRRSRRPGGTLAPAAGRRRPRVGEPGPARQAGPARGRHGELWGRRRGDVQKLAPLAPLTPSARTCNDISKSKVAKFTRTRLATFDSSRTEGPAAGGM